MGIIKEDKEFYTIEESKEIINSYIETSADTLIAELHRK
jgi:hypothetical protein